MLPSPFPVRWRGADGLGVAETKCKSYPGLAKGPALQCEPVGRWGDRHQDRGKVGVLQLLHPLPV